MNAKIQTAKTLQARSAQAVLIKGNTSKVNYCSPGTVWVNDQCSRSTRLQICCPDLCLCGMQLRTKRTVRVKDSIDLPSKIQC